MHYFCFIALQWRNRTQ